MAKPDFPKPSRDMTEDEYEAIKAEYGHGPRNCETCWEVQDAMGCCCGNCEINYFSEESDRPCLGS